MNSEEYINQVNRLIDLQNTYVQIFLALIALVLGFIGFLQWKYSTTQIEHLKEEVKQETIKEIEESLGVLSLTEFKINLQKKIEDVETELNMFEHIQLDFEITKLFNEKDIRIWYITNIMDVYRSQILRNISNFNYFVSRVDGSISHNHSEGNIDINSPHIDKIIKKMSEFETELNEKSEKLIVFKNYISYSRKEINSR